MVVGHRLVAWIFLRHSLIFLEIPGVYIISDFTSQYLEGVADGSGDLSTKTDKDFSKLIN